MGGKSKSAKKAQGRKPRTTITEAIKLELVKLCVEHECNPKVTKQSSWIPVVQSLKAKFDVDISVRVAQTKVKDLLTKYQRQQLVFKTGEEEYEDELKSLLEELVGQAEKEDIQLTFVNGPVFDKDEVDSELGGTASDSETSPINIKKEKKQADEERDTLVSKSSDFAPEPTGIRRRKINLTFDEEMIKKKQDHDNNVELQRLDLERIKTDRDYEIETKRIKLEEDKLKLAAEDSKRKDDLQSQQLKSQQEMLELMKLLANR